jgi:choline monooxygenase
MVTIACPIPADRLRRVLAPTNEASGLPNIAYTSADYYRHERDVVLGRSWAGLVFTDVIPQRPCAYPVDFMGLPLLVTRDRSGKLRVFHNVCSHRGIKLVAEPTDVSGVISCRYHCWSYALNGDLKATPHIGGVGQHTSPGFNNAEHGLKAVPCAEFLGVLFVNLSGDAPPFDQHIAPLRARAMRLIGAGGLALLRPGASDAGMTLEVGCNWKLAVENYCESYHLPWVHPSLNSYSRLEDHYYFADGTDFSGQGSLAYRLSDVAGTKLPRLPEWPAEQLNVAEYPSLYPNVLLGFHADHAFAIILVPLAPDRTREDVRLFLVAEGAEAEGYRGCRAATHEAWRGVFNEDVFAVEGLQAGRQSPGYGGGVFAPGMDQATHHFHRWVAMKLLSDRADATGLDDR